MKLNRFLALVFVIAGYSVLAQQIVIPANNAGAGNATGSLHRKPLGSYYGYERSGFIYTQAELGNPGTINITSLAFYCDTVNSFIAANTPVTVYLKETPDTAFAASSTLSNELSGATLVYSGSLSSATFSKNNWTSIIFSTNFTLTNTSNLKIIIETNAGGVGNEGLLSKGFRLNDAGAKRFQYWQQDNSIPNGAGTLDTLRPNITINYIPSTTCTGLPSAGTIVASDTAVCKNSTAAFYLQGNTSGSGISYLWQTSVNNINWTDVTANNLPNYSLLVDTLYYIRTIVSCSVQSDTTPVITINKLLPIYCYCYASLGGNCSGYSIDSLSINGTSFNAFLSGCENNVAPHYSKYPASGNYTTTLNVSQSYTMAIRQTGNNTTSMWIDYDHDGVFEHNEWKRLTTTSVTNGVQNVAFSIPATAFNGLTGMRVRSRANGFINDSTNACTTFSSGETEDFLINISGGLTIGIAKAGNSTISSTIYPNPNNGSFYFYSNDVSGELEFTIVDLLGKNVFHSFMQHTSNTELKTNLPYGSYFLFVKNKEGKLLTKKLVVE